MSTERTTSLFAAVVEITNKCNLRCPHCASDSGCAREDEMSLEELRGEVCKAGCSAMAISQTGTLTETPFCIRQLEQEKIIKEMIGNLQ